MRTPLCFAVVIIAALAPVARAAEAAAKPNVIYGDLGAYGQKKIKTRAGQRRPMMWPSPR